MIVAARGKRDQMRRIDERTIEYLGNVDTQPARRTLKVIDLQHLSPEALTPPARLLFVIRIFGRIFRHSACKRDVPKNRL